ncbi:MAG: hypothetical protein LBK25_05810 [Treponema sp.]|jgi:hypothetical protein|nr:hypothetical protein [Treponema sp.]
MQNIYSGFKAFLKGLVSIFDITGQSFLRSLPDFSGGFERDAQALAGDWRQVGQDMRSAMNKVSQEVQYGKR